MGSDIDLAEPRSFQNAAHAVGVRECEWAWRLRGVSGLRRQMIGRVHQRQVIEPVFLQRTPADKGESPGRPETTTNVDKRRGGINEEHHSKSRKGSVERSRFKWEYLRICLDEPYSLARFGGACRECQHRSRQVYPHYGAVRGD